MSERAYLFSNSGRLEDALQAAAKLRTLDAATAAHLYDAACVYGRCAASIDPADKGTTDEQKVRREGWVIEGLETLTEAFARGWDNVNHTRKDPDLEPLRERPEFEAVLKAQSGDAAGGEPARETPKDKGRDETDGP